MGNAVHTPLNASATTAGALISSSTFDVPPYQREYSWAEDEVSEFWNDLSNASRDEPYFMGLVILTDEDGRKQIVDGQQRILTLTLLAAALYKEALESGRSSLAERIKADFLRSIDYETDETHPRVTLSDSADNVTLQAILSDVSENVSLENEMEDSFSSRMRKAFRFLRESLRKDLAPDPFKRLGAWTDFLTNRLYFAVFVHPDSGSAYRVFEVINTRGRELTTADLLKNYVLSQTPKQRREDRYRQWQEISRQFSQSGASSFVQYIRHVVTVQAGHILPKDLFDFIARRITHGGKKAPTTDELMGLLEKNLPLYLQMMDPSLDGPADSDALKIFSAINSLGIISVRPILLAIFGVNDSLDGMRYVLRLVVRRIVVGTLGTGNVERRFGETARKVKELNNWHVVEEELSDLNPTREEFLEQLRKRSFNKGVLTFLRRSIIFNDMTPQGTGVLHFIKSRQAVNWVGFGEDDAAFWGATIGNTLLSTMERRPKGVNDWEDFKRTVLNSSVNGEWVDELSDIDVWNADAVEKMGEKLAGIAADVWYS